MAIPVIAGSTTAVATSASLTLTIPSGVSNGDLLLILVGNDNGKAGEGFIDNTTGWTFHHSYGGGDGAYIGFYSKIADGTNEDSVTINSTDADDMYGWYLHITGQHATNPVRVLGSSQTGAASSVTVSALTTDTNSASLAFSQVAYDGADATFSESGTGWSMATPLTQGAGGTGAGGVYSTKEISTPSTTTGTSIIGFGIVDGYAATQFVIAGIEPVVVDYYDGVGTIVGQGSMAGSASVLQYYNSSGVIQGEGVLTGIEHVTAYYGGSGSLTGQGSFIGIEDVVNILFDILITSPVEPIPISTAGGTVNTTDNGDGTWNLHSFDPITQCIFATNNDITEATILKGSTLVNCTSMFAACSGLLILDVSSWDTTNVTSFKTFTQAASNLVEVRGASTLIRGNVTDMYQMCLSCFDLVVLDMSGWDVSNVDNMGEAFKYCSLLETPDISNWTTSTELDNIASLFRGNLNIIDFDFTPFANSSIRLLLGVLAGCTNLKTVDLTGMNFTATEYFNDLFNGCTSLICITNIDTSNVGVSKTDMFKNCTSLVQPHQVNQDLITSTDGYDWTNSFDCADLLANDFVFLITSPTLPVVNATDGVFTIVDKLDGTYLASTSDPVSQFDFNDDANITDIEVGRSGSTLTSLVSTFTSCNGIIALDIYNLNTSNVDAFYYSFSSVSSLTSDKFIFNPNMVTSSATTTRGLFSGCEGLTSLALSSFDMSNVETVERMFNDCDGLAALDLSGWNVLSLTNTAAMAYRCLNLLSIDMTGWNASLLTCDGMFRDTPLTFIDFSTIDFSNCTDFDNLFNGCNALICISNIDTTAPGATKASMFANTLALLNPTPTEVGDIIDIDGANYINSNECPSFFTNGSGSIYGFGRFTGIEQLTNYYIGSGSLIGEGRLLADGHLVYDVTGTVIGSGVFIGSSYLLYNNQGAVIGEGVLTGIEELTNYYTSSGTAIGQGIFSGDGDVIGAITYYGGTGQVIGMGILTADGSIVEFGSGTFQGTGILSADGQLLFETIGTLQGQGVFTGEGIALTFLDTAGTLIGEGNFIGDAQLVSNETGVVQGQGVLTGDNHIIYNTSGEIVGQGILVGDSYIIYNTSGEIVGNGVFIGEGMILQFLNNSGSIVGQSNLLGSAQLVVNESGLIQGTGILSAEGALLHKGVGSVVGIGILTGNERVIQIFSGSGNLSGYGILTGDGSFVNYVRGQGDILGQGIFMGSGITLQVYRGAGNLRGQGVLLAEGEVLTSNIKFFALNLSAF